MIHKYKLAGYNIVIDVNSGAVHVVDDLTYDMLDNIEPPFSTVCPDNVVEKLSKFHRKEDIWTCYDEVVQLYREKILFNENEPEICCSERKEVSPVRAICLNISHDCNLRCGYCFASNGSFGGERMMMSAETGRKAVDFLIANSGSTLVPEVYFFGGEPLMNFETMKEVVRYAREKETECGKKFSFSITTNGTLLDDEKTEFINREMENVVLSVDGRREVNDSVRIKTDGTGIYDDIIPKFKKLVEGRNGRDYYIRGTYTKKNLDFSADVFSLLGEGFDRISIEPVSVSSSSEYAVTELELPKVFREYDILVQKMIGCEREGRGFDFFHFNIDLDGTGCEHRKIRGCGCGNEYISVAPSGNIYPCHQFTGDRRYLIGNIETGMDDSLRSCFAAADVTSKNECRKCWARFYCSGGCNANNYHCSGDIMNVHKMSCLILKKRIECAIVLRVVKEEKEGNI